MQEVKEMPKTFVIGCASIGKIMTGTVGLSEAQEKAYESLQRQLDQPEGISETQAAKVQKLLDKADTDKGLADSEKIWLEQTISKRDNPKVLTDTQRKIFLDLREKKRSPELPQTAKSYCEEWIKRQLYQRRKHFSNKYTEKGLISEDDAIDFCTDYYKWGLALKNEEFFENEFIKGVPDVIRKDEVIDVKSSWDCFTFPLFEEEIPTDDYYWQLQGYMILCDKPKAGLCYCLINTPHHLIEREARWRALGEGYDELDQDYLDSVTREMTYSQYPDDLRIKRYDIERDPEAEAKIIERVKMCREYMIKDLTYDFDKNTIRDIEKLKIVADNVGEEA